MLGNQKGITLVELIAALALVSIIAAIAWTALSIGFKHTASETNKTQLQQEANLIVATITNEHRRNDYYYLRMNAGTLEINTCNGSSVTALNCEGFTSLMANHYVYTGTINGVDFMGWDPAQIIDPKKKHLDLSLNVTDPANPARSVKVETTLTRILTE